MRVRQAPGFYAVITAGAVLGTALARGMSPIRLLFMASLVAGVATPVGLAALLLVAGNPDLMGDRPASGRLRVAGRAVTALVTLVTAIFLAQQVHLIRRWTDCGSAPVSAARVLQMPGVAVRGIALSTGSVGC
jgi:Mn2+/Fe2+ NRAMP family transporter